MLLESGKLPSDEMFIRTKNLDGTETLTPNPDKYEVSGGRENWIFTFEDGTSTVVNRYDLSKAKKTLANEITPVISKLKESGFEEKKLKNLKLIKMRIANTLLMKVQQALLQI